MRFLYHGKDGGYESTVSGYWLFEIKWLCSVVLLRFAPGSREAYHSHAFNSISWLLSGCLIERRQIGEGQERRLVTPDNVYRPSLRPIYTWRDTFHRVTSQGTSWVLSFRGPWAQSWREYLPKEKRFVTLTAGRQTVAA